MSKEKTFVGVQKDILETTAINQLVSAGAGSGKTTVMIEKIADLLLSQTVDVENLLVVTFTVLAAAEMKERLIKKMQKVLAETNDKDRILRLIEKIETASIDTIDGFASKTIKKYFYDLQISPNIEIISDATRDYYLTKAINKTLRDLEKATPEKMHIMLDLFSGNKRSLEPIKNLLLNNYYNVINLEDYEQFLINSKNEYGDCIKSEKTVNTYLCDMVQNVEQAIVSQYEMFEENVKSTLTDFIDELQKINSYVSFKTNLQVLYSISKPEFSTKQYKENESLKSLMVQINEIFNFKNELQKNNINEDFDIKNQEIVKYFDIFLELLQNFIKNYNKLKEKNNLIDFNDLNRLMLKLLKNENIKHELQEKYTYVFIDEYQDVNPLQDKLMNMIVGNNTRVFMVGDVKQSIYGFRGASPEWFLEKYNLMKKSSSNGKAFDMNINFRSSPKILNFINDVFSKLMTQKIADINYARDAMIEPMRTDIVDDKVCIKLVAEQKAEDVASGIYSVKEHTQKDTLNTKDKEALLVLNIITNLIGKDFYDANEKQIRKMTYKDIAILSRSEKDENAIALIELLKANNVPLNLTNKLDVNKSETIKLVLSILKTVIGTADDVDYLAAFLALTDLEIDDIIELRDKDQTLYDNLFNCKDNIKVADGFNKINMIKQACNTKTNKELLYFILDDLKLRYYILQKTNGEQEISLLEEFISKLSTIEDGLGIAEFIEVVESNVSKSTDFNSSDSDDSVTFQTIHKSKGLEYPVVILYNASKRFSYLRDNDAINFNAEIGLGVEYFDQVNRVKTDSLPKFAINLINRAKGYKEEMRLLYVALTRAKNKLYIVGTYSDKLLTEEEVNKTSFTKMIMSTYLDRIQLGNFETDNCIIELIDDVEAGAQLKTNAQREIEKVADFVYPYQEKFNIPIKNTVTGINSQSVEKLDYKFDKIIKTDVQYEQQDKAQIGVHYHKALELLDFTKVYQQNTDFEDVDYEKIKKAHIKLSNLVHNAINIKKEAEFMMYVPYGELVHSSIKDKVLVQGVVDLIVEFDDHITIVDYKFSSLPVAVLKQKYAEQLNLYKKAVESAFKKPVADVYIYSINTNELA